MKKNGLLLCLSFLLLGTGCAKPQDNDVIQRQQRQIDELNRVVNDLKNTTSTPEKLKEEVSTTTQESSISSTSTVTSTPLVPKDTVETKGAPKKVVETTKKVTTNSSEKIIPLPTTQTEDFKSVYLSLIDSYIGQFQNLTKYCDDALKLSDSRINLITGFIDVNNKMKNSNTVFTDSKLSESLDLLDQMYDNDIKMTESYRKQIPMIKASIQDSTINSLLTLKNNVSNGGIVSRENLIAYGETLKKLDPIWQKWMDGIVLAIQRYSDFNTKSNEQYRESWRLIGNYLGSVQTPTLSPSQNTYIQTPLPNFHPTTCYVRTFAGLGGDSQSSVECY